MSINKKFIALLVILLLVFSIVFYYNNKQAEEISSLDFSGDWSGDFLLAAGTCADDSSHNVWGWAYAEPIGPISLSCLNCDTNGDGVIDNANCGSMGSDIANYGVKIGETGSNQLSGYAWSAAIGPISFNEDEICLNSPCIADDFPSGASVESDHVAKAVWVKDGLAQITGWGRALAACGFNGTKCTTNSASSAAGGWDGWIKFDKTTILSGTSKPYYTNGGSVYNTVIETVEAIHVVDGNAWAGVLDSEDPPSAVLGEIRFLDSAETSFDPNLACPTEAPTADFLASCMNGEVDHNGTCYYGENPTVSLVNGSSDPDDIGCNLTGTDIQTSSWAWDGSTKSTGAGKANAAINGSTASASEDITLTVEDSDEYTDDVTKTINFKRGIVADFSCCLVGAGVTCVEDSDFKDCDTEFLGTEVEEGTKLYFRDNTSVPNYTVPSEGHSISSRSWAYDMGPVTETDVNGTDTGEDAYIFVRPGGIITLTATDTVPLSDDKARNIDDIFGNVLLNPDFHEF